jgi:hypothetical protein
MSKEEEQNTLQKAQDQILLKAFAENKPTFEAVRRVLLAGMLGDNFDRQNWVWNIDKSLSDSAYGREVKITRKAIEWISGAFDQISRYAQSNPQPTPQNEAR